MSTLALALLSAPAFAGTKLIVHDTFTGNASVNFQGGFIQYECWATIFSPDAEDYPFTLRGVDVLLGGRAATEEYLVQVYAPLAGMDITERWADEEVFTLQGSDEAFNRLVFAEAELSLPTINSGNVAIAMCHESLDNAGTPQDPNYPAIGADTDGIDFPTRHLIGTFLDGFLPSSRYGLPGDWIMRLCIESEDIQGNECGEGTNPGGGDDTGGGGDDTGDGGDGAFFVQSITPASAPQGEAVDVVILGDGFVPGAEARIGGISLTGTTIANAETITGRTSTALPAGLHDVEVILPGGESDYIAGAFEVTGGCGCASRGGAGGLAAAWAALAFALLRRPRRA